MIKFTTLIVAMLIVNTLVFGQKLSDDFTVTTSKPYQVIDAGSKEYISLGDGTVIMAKMGRGVVNIQKFDVNSMEEVARNTYNDLPKGSKFINLIKLKNRAFYFYQVWNKKAKQFTVFSREIDADDAKFKEPVELLSTSRKAVKYNNAPGDLSKSITTFAAFAGYGSHFYIYKSFDDSKIMIKFRLYPKNKKDAINYDEIGFFVFDNEMNKIWGKEIKMPYTEKQMNNVAYAVSSTGKVLMLLTNNKDETYEAFLFNDSGKLNAIDLNLSSEQYVRRIIVKEQKNGEFVCSSFYADGINMSYNPIGGLQSVFNANGLMYFRISNEGEVSDAKKFDFSKGFIQQNLNKKQKTAVAKKEKDGTAGILDLIIKKVNVKDDGVYIIGERQYFRKEFWMGPQTKTVYHFANIVAMKINNKGELVWMKKLPKHQAGIEGCGQMSIAYMEGEGADYVAYVDNPKNIRLSERGVPIAHKDGLGGYLTTYKIDNKTGALEKHTICDMNKIDKYKAYQFKVTRIFEALDGVFLMEFYAKGKKDVMVKFELNKK